MTIKVIEAKGRVLARMIPISEWKDGLRFFSEDEESIQVGTWNYEMGKTLAPHIHNEIPRIVNHTCEVLFIHSGEIMASIYDHEECLVEEIHLIKGDTLILIEGGHGYEILEDNTRVLEIKNGPYPGADIDRRRITPKNIS